MSWIHAHGEVIGLVACGWMVVAGIVGIRVSRYRNTPEGDN